MVGKVDAVSIHSKCTLRKSRNINILQIWQVNDLGHAQVAFLKYYESYAVAASAMLDPSIS